MSSRQRAFVTGGSRGIGLCIAQMLVRDGYDVCVFDRESCDEVESFICKAKSLDNQCRHVVGDVRDPSCVCDALESIVGCWDGLDVVINNAGIVRDQVSWKMTDESWHDVIDINLSGVFNVCRAAIPYLRQSPGGAIVNMASINGMRGKFGQANYAAAKAGVIGLTKTLAKELARFDITVNAIAPGFIETDITKSMSPKARSAAVDEILMGRVGTVEDVGEAVLFLCSHRARFITGEVIRVDGGQYI